MMRINYIYGGIQYNKYMRHWFPIKYGYAIEYDSNELVCKLSNLDFIYRDTTNERSIRVGKIRANKFEKLYRLGNIIYIAEDIKKSQKYYFGAKNAYIKLHWLQDIVINLLQIEKNLMKTENME